MASNDKGDGSINDGNLHFNQWTVTLYITPNCRNLRIIQGERERETLPSFVLPSLTLCCRHLLLFLRLLFYLVKNEPVSKCLVEIFQLVAFNMPFQMPFNVLQPGNKFISFLAQNTFVIMNEQSPKFFKFLLFDLFSCIRQMRQLLMFLNTMSIITKRSWLTKSWLIKKKFE